MHTGEHRHQLGAGLGMSGERGVDAAPAPGEELAGGELAAARLTWIGCLEELDQEIPDGALRRGLGRRGARPLGRDPRLPDGPGDACQQRQRHGRARRDGHPVASDELRRPVADAVGPGAHRHVVEVASHVARELLDRRVPPVGLLPDGSQHDGVQIAPEPAATDLRRHRARRLGFLEEDRAHHLGGRTTLEAVHPSAGEQLVQHGAEGVHVGRRGHRLATDLLGRGVLRRHHPHAALGLVVLAIHQLGDAEVEQLGLAVRGDQDIGRLEVAMDDEVLVGVAHGVTDVEKQSEPGVHVEAVRLAVPDDRSTLDELDGEPRLPLGGDAAIEQPGDVGVVEPRQDLAFGEEAAVDGGGVHPFPDELEGDALLELTVGPLGEIHHAHPAPRQLAHDPIRPDPAAHGGVVDGPLGRGREAVRDGIGQPPAVELEEPPGGGVGPEQGLDLPLERGVPAARLGHPPGTRGRRDLERPVEQPVGLGPVEPGLRRHSVSSW